MSKYGESYEASHALIVGVDEYENWSSLSTSVRGANALEELLRSTFGFDTKILPNSAATRENILGWFEDLDCNPEDRVLFYFSGHGFTHRDTGYLALKETSSRLTALKINDLVEESDHLKAKHVILIIDACFSGLIFSRSIPSGEFSQKKLISNLVSRRVRYAITAGSEEVDDNNGPAGQYSVFTHFLLSGLRGEAFDKGTGCLRGRDLGNYLEEKVGGNLSTRHKPNHGALSGDGDFIFTLPRRRLSKGCIIEDRRGLLDTHQSSLLRNLEIVDSLIVLERITSGFSGSAIFLVAVNSRGGGPNGLHYCKIYRTKSGVEKEKHQQVRETNIGKYIPELTDFTPVVDGWMASLYSIAHQSTRVEALSNLLRSDVTSSLINLRKLVDILQEWNNHSDDIKYMEPSEILTLPFRSYDPVERVVEPIEDFIVGLKRSHPHILFQFLDQVLPNPIAYIYDRKYWKALRPIAALIGHSHGDLHTNNIICVTNSSGNGTAIFPSLIDFDTYDDQNLLFFDIAYLEIDIAIRVLPNDFGPDSWSQVSAYLAEKIELSDRPRLGPEATTLNNLLMPLRSAVVELTRQLPNLSGDLEVTYWIARTAAGLAFARKRKVNSVERKLALLLSAQSLSKALTIYKLKELPSKQPFWIEWYLDEATNDLVD